MSELMMRDKFESSVLKHYAQLMANAFLLTQDVDEAKDLVQDTLVKAWRYYPTFEDDNFKSWILTICKRVFIDSLRKKNRRPQGNPIEYCVDQPFYELDEGFSDQTLSTLNRLNPKHRTITLMVLVHGYSHAETAKVLSVPTTTIKSALRSVREKFKATYL